VVLDALTDVHSPEEIQQLLREASERIAVEPPHAERAAKEGV
jgi:hypothetical protein